jgi:hypothetical protein
MGQGDGNNGYFVIPFESYEFDVIASDGGGWEHVSVSMPKRTPSWKQMCYVKTLFWDDEDVVIQYHPAKKDYVNMHEHTLHMWRPTGQELPTPPKLFVGI